MAATAPPGGTPLVVTTETGAGVAEQARRAWDDGHAICPVDPRLPDRTRRALVARVESGEVPDGVAAVVVTSGTTGTPKVVSLTRHGMEVMGRGYTAALDGGPDDTWLACMPLHHVASLGVVARGYVTGMRVVVHDALDLDRVASAPAREGATIVSVVPTILRRLLDARAPVDDFRRIVVGGAPCPPSLRARAEAAGATIVDAYGLTETWGGFALDGVPIDGVEAKVEVDTREIVVRGPVVTPGYLDDPARTAAALDADGWFHTGDIGIFEDGRLRVVDRIDDLVITGGVNVSPSAVEDALARHPALADVCVVGVADDEWGQRVVAYAVVAPGRDLPQLTDVRDFARHALAPAQLPRELRIVDEIPRSASGKPLRRLLRP